MPTQRFLALIAAFLVTGCAACTKDSHSTVDTGAVEASDRLPGAVDRTPLPGIDIARLDSRRVDAFYRLVATLQSPCGKAHSLRTSVTSDTECRRASFAARLVVEMLVDEATEPEIKADYKAKYESKAAPTAFALAGVPRSGPADAPIVLVEFYDYACGACQMLKPELEAVGKQFTADVVTYYKMFPLTQHKDSPSAAQAALAAHAQGRFGEMHELLFARAPAHTRADVLGYAAQLGLDVAKFEADYDAAAARVKADLQDGGDAGVDHTPTLYFNGLVYDGPRYAKYLRLWVEEEIAVNR